MSNLMSMLYTGVSGILASQAKMSVTGHNTANIDNPNYCRQRVNVATQYTAKAQNGAFGYGVKVVEVVRVYDELLAKTLRNENTSLRYWENTQQSVKEMMAYFNELDQSGATLGDSLKSYFNAWQELGNTAPDASDESYIKRTDLLAKAETLCSQITDNRKMYEDQKNKIDISIRSQVSRINDIAGNIAELNKQIAAVEASGENANDLRDSRDALVNEIATYANINVVDRPNGEIGVFLGGMAIVDSSVAHQLFTKIDDSTGKMDIYWKTNNHFDGGTKISSWITGGEIGSNLHVRDELIPDYIDELDQLAKTIISETNKLHASGQGLKRFDKVISSNSVTNPFYSFDTLAGELPFEMQPGGFKIVAYDSSNNIIGTYTVDFDPSKDTLHGMAEKISNADGTSVGGPISATITPDNQLKIMGADGVTFAFGDDTSGFLAAVGVNNFFTGTDSSNMAVNQFVMDNPEYISTSSAGAPGDNRIAFDIMKLQQREVAPGGITINEFYGYYTGKIASDKSQIDIFALTKSMTVEQYEAKWASLTGVNMSEEQADLVQFQRVFEANSRYLNAVDEMLNMIVNSLGLVGR